MGWHDRFGGDPWSLEALPPPWGDRSSIYEHIRRYSDNGASRLVPVGASLPDDDAFNGKTLRWAAGAQDGVLSHHMKRGDAELRVRQIVTAARELLAEADELRLRHFYGLVVQDSLLSVIAPVLERIAKEIPRLNSERLHKLARYMAMRAGDREAVKFGVAVLGLLGLKNDLEVVATLGRHDEFTLFAVVAIRDILPAPDRELWRMAKDVDGWGRVQAVKRLRRTEDPEIKAWLLRDGFRNSIRYEYTACLCARCGNLAQELGAEVIDDQLLLATGEIIAALITGRGGPAEGIDDYDEAAEACESYLRHLQPRGRASLEHFLAVGHLQRFLEQAEDWPTREANGWTPERRAQLTAICRQVLGWKDWREQALAAQASTDGHLSWLGDRVGRDLGIDSWDQHFARVRSDARSGSWYRLMQETDEGRIDRVIDLAESVLSIAEIASGPADEVGLGPSFAAHSALGHVLSGLARFPGRGWRLVDAALRSPVVRNRNLALKTLAAWGRDRWPASAADALARALDEEPRDDVRERIRRVIEGQPFS
jgi:hypothetical protein